MAQKYYFEQQRYQNTPSGTPNKATFVYAESGASKDLYLKDIHTHQFMNARQLLKEKQENGYYEKGAEFKELNTPVDKCKWSDVKRASKVYNQRDQLVARRIK